MFPPFSTKNKRQLVMHLHQQESAKADDGPWMKPATKGYKHSVHRSQVFLTFNVTLKSAQNTSQTIQPRRSPFAHENAQSACRRNVGAAAAASLHILWGIRLQTPYLSLLQIERPLSPPLEHRQ
jgi:hypothetical protein